MSRVFRCPPCKADVEGSAWNAHLVTHRAHRVALFDAFVADHEPTQGDVEACDGRTRISAHWDDEERARFDAPATTCGDAIVQCECLNTMCAQHAMGCTNCGRFACLRHRISGLCPSCSPDRLRKHVGVPKHDPFTKRTTMVYRSYAAQPPEPWPRLVGAARGNKQPQTDVPSA